VNRAERRKITREVRRRSPKKKGSRSALRNPSLPEEPSYTTLEKAGFVIGQPRVLVPGEKGI
jgi:hypothetical protein